MVNKQLAARAALGAAAALTAATVAGYGLLRPATPLAGMARQIANGERVSAATRAHFRARETRENIGGQAARPISTR